MARNFFSRFPKIGYDISGDGSFVLLTNIVNNVALHHLDTDSSTNYTFYEITDGERPDTVSYNLYGTPEYHWTFFIINNDLRGGLSDAWPISNQQFERMLENEYDPYLAITMLPANDSRNGFAENGLLNLTEFRSDYIPFLKIVNSGLTEKAQILKYDNDRLQLIVYDVRKTLDNTQVLSTENFINELSVYRLIWDNPFVEGSNEYQNCEALRRSFVARHIEIYSEFDPSAIVNPELIGGSTPEEISAGILALESAYVFGKQFVPAARAFRWENYRNAANVYFFEDDDGNKFSRTAYDVISNQDILTPTFLSNFEVEELINESKRKIKVIRPDRIADFVNKYFEVLNGK